MARGRRFRCHIELNTAHQNLSRIIGDNDLAVECFRNLRAVVRSHFLVFNTRYHMRHDHLIDACVGRHLANLIRQDMVCSKVPFNAIKLLLWHVRIHLANGIKYCRNVHHFADEDICITGQLFDCLAGPGIPCVNNGAIVHVEAE